MSLDILQSKSAILLALLALLAGCGDQGDSGDNSMEPRAEVTVDGPGNPDLDPPPCPAGSANCERASGQILYVERVDPDGDGDAHFVLVSDEGITGPGISVIDVRAELRPRPLPRPGDMLAASGPVFEGSFGQLQIQADEVVFARR